MKDFMGFELNVDDWVVAILPHYRELVLGRVVKLTPKKVRVEYQLNKSPQDHLYDPTSLVKVDGSHLTIKLLKGGQ